MRSLDPALPLLVVTGAAAAGKTTACRALEREPGVLALDADVIAAGAAAVADGRTDYAAFWRYVLSIASGVTANGVVPVICCVCLPHQVLVNAECGAFSGVHLLALTCAPDELERRIRGRAGDDSTVRNLARHLAINDELRRTEVPDPHSFTVFDNTGLTAEDTTARALQYVQQRSADTRSD